MKWNREELQFGLSALKGMMKSYEIFYFPDDVVIAKARALETTIAFLECALNQMAINDDLEVINKNWYASNIERKLLEEAL